MDVGLNVAVGVWVDVGGRVGVKVGCGVDVGLDVAGGVWVDVGVGGGVGVSVGTSTTIRVGLAGSLV